MLQFSWLIIFSQKKTEFDGSKAHVCLMVAIVVGSAENASTSKNVRSNIMFIVTPNTPCYVPSASGSH